MKIVIVHGYTREGRPCTSVVAGHAQDDVLYTASVDAKGLGLARAKELASALIQKEMSRVRNQH